MKDRKPKYPGRVMLTPVSGQTNVYDMVRADEPEDVGTPLNKNTFLTDETAVELGLDPAYDPNPNDALHALTERTIADSNGIMKKMMKIPTGNSNVGIKNDKNNIIFGYGFGGKFYTGDPNYPLALRGSNENPTYNGFGLLKIQTGSYTGTGTYGESNPNSLTFDFVPKIVHIFAKTGTNMVHTLTIFPQDGYALFVGTGYNPYGVTNVTLSGNTVTWYSDNSSYQVNIQANQKGIIYNYLAIR